MAQKCANKGCGKSFTDPEEPCVYHSGPPIFHEGQKGWKCCKPRVLTFDEFLTIPPCTTGKHTTVETTTTKADLQVTPTSNASATTPSVMTKEGKESFATDQRTRVPTAPPKEKKEVEKEDKPIVIEEDEPGVKVIAGTKCRRNACGVAYEGEQTRESKCEHHPGVALFHEGSKGWTCCKRRVLEFDEFMKIKGCTEGNHMFVGAKNDQTSEELVICRTDFYQTYTHLNVSLFLKKIDKERARITFHENTIDVDLPTTDNKRYTATLPLYARITPGDSDYKIMGTKAELKLKKSDGTSWPTLRSDEESDIIIQVGRPGMA